MRINLNDPNDFTFENIRKLISSEDDSVHTQFRITRDGYLFLSKDIDDQNIQNIIFRFETNCAYNGYVGKEAAKLDLWVQRVYKVIAQNWPKPMAVYSNFLIF